MWITPEGNEKLLFDLLITIPPNWTAAEQLLNAAKLTSSQITRVAIAYAEECYREVADYAYEQSIPHPTTIIPNLHSTFIYDIINFLLEYGLEPNGIYENCNVMKELQYVDNEFLAADTLNLLLERGGDYNLSIDGETFFQEIDFDVFFGAIEQYNRPYFAAIVHCWMVVIGHGARCLEDTMHVFKMYDSSECFDWDMLKNHRNYYFGLTHLEKGFAISIYDKETLWEVARIT